MRSPRVAARSASSARSSAHLSGSPEESSATFEHIERRGAPSSSIRSNFRAARSKFCARAAPSMPSKSRSGCSATISRPRSSAMARASRGRPLKKVRSFSKISTARKPARAAAASLTSNVPPMHTVAIDHLNMSRDPGFAQSLSAGELEAKADHRVMMRDARGFALAGVMGDPVMHSRSPALHGYWLARHNLAGRLSPAFDCAGSAWRGFARAGAARLRRMQSHDPT